MSARGGPARTKVTKIPPVAKAFSATPNLDGYLGPDPVQPKNAGMLDWLKY